MNEAERLAMAERIRRACVQAARNGYEEAAMAGLCAEGALEAALGAIERLDLETILSAPERPADGPR
ncbi:acetyltransferase [Salinisphaera sp. SWV1]|uniref:acetyltransferase n=1 Tax=Salinisphaera sp. SWV1 TaxID=3454139 RepID=UPI003F840C36